MSKSAKKTTARRNLRASQKVTWVRGAQNPFRVGSGAFKRIELVRKFSGSGRTVGQLRVMKSLRRTTVKTAHRLALVKVA